METPPEATVASGGLFRGLQLWVKLPREQGLYGLTSVLLYNWTVSHNTP